MFTLFLIIIYFSSCLVRFASGEETFLAVGVAKDLVLIPRSHSACYINLYKFVNSGKGLELVHKVFFQFFFNLI